MGSELLLQISEDLGLYLAITLAGNDTVVTISRKNISEQQKSIIIIIPTHIVLRAQNFMLQPAIAEFPSITFPDDASLANFTATTNSTASITLPRELLRLRSRSSGGKYMHIYVQCKSQVHQIGHAHT